MKHRTHIIRKYTSDLSKEPFPQKHFMQWWNQMTVPNRLRQYIYMQGNKVDDWLCEQKDFIARKNFLYDSGKWRVWCILFHAHDFTGGNIGQQPYCVYCCKTDPKVTAEH